ncbi:disks large-associated protein 5 isoform 2-T2 [Discoglossus pictus]
MDTKSQFNARYKKDLSIDNLRTKVARRKSITQKENRHNEFKRSRGLSLADVNISLVKEFDLLPVEEVSEISILKGNENKDATSKNKEKLMKERREKLLRFKEEKQMRKLKEQREKASRGTFKCGIYKPDVTIPPAIGSQNGNKVKPKEAKEKPAPLTRVTRSMAKVESVGKLTTRSQHVKTVVPNRSKVTSEHPVPKGRGTISSTKKPEKENKVLSAPPPATRATAVTGTKVPPKNTTVTKLPKKITKENKQSKPVKDENDIESQIVQQSSTEEEELQDVVRESALNTETVMDKNVTVKDRTLSFAPENFEFQPLDGLSAFKFKPMTPRRADEFLTPCYTWSPVEPGSPSKPDGGEQDPEQVIPPEVSPKLAVCEAQMDTQSCAFKEKEIPSDVPSVALDDAPPVSLITSTEVVPNEKLPTVPDEPKHDVPYFRNILISETQRLSEMCRRWDGRVEIDIPEDAKALIRTTVGQTRLLMTERFKQFEGLVDNCEFKRGEKETTCTDLDGFWDMVYFQIEDVGHKFVNLEKLEENSWQQPNTVQPKKVVRKKVVAVTTTKPSQGDNGRAAARSRLAAIKAALKNKAKPEEPVVEAEATAPERPMQVDQVVFEAGFFRIESPAKVVKGTRTSQRFSQTPKSLLKSLKYSENPQVNRLAPAEEFAHAQNASSTVKSPVRKMLFDAEEESALLTEHCSVPADEENPKSDTVTCGVIDLGKYLVPAEHVSLASPTPAPFTITSVSEVSLVEDNPVAESFVDDVFMCSPEKPPHQPIAESPVVEKCEMLESEEVKTASNPLDFLGSCTPSHPTEVKCEALKFDAVVATNDLIVFSPLDK